MILSDIYNIKGTRAAFFAILKLLKLNYKNIIYSVQPNGCTDIILIFDQDVRINIQDIASLDMFSKEVFPLCLTLSGVTNCATYETSASYAGQVIPLGQHFLDYTFTLDMSRLDTAYGAIDPSISNTIAMSICNETVTDLNSSITLPTTTVLTHDVVADMTYIRGSEKILDYSLTLDMFSPQQYYMFQATEGRATSNDLVYTHGPFGTNLSKQALYQFYLDRDLMDKTDFRPLDGYLPYVYSINALDNGLILDKTLNDSAQIISVINTNYTQRVIADDLNLNTAASASTASYSLQDKLDYSKLSNSQYLAMLQI